MRRPSASLPSVMAIKTDALATGLMIGSKVTGINGGPEEPGKPSVHGTRLFLTIYFRDCVDFTRTLLSMHLNRLKKLSDERSAMSSACMPRNSASLCATCRT